MRYNASTLFCYGMGTLITAASSTAFAQTTSNADALKLISRTADQICQSAPLEQTSSGAKLSGDAQAKLGSIVGKLADGHLEKSACPTRRWSDSITVRVAEGASDGSAWVF